MDKLEEIVHTLSEEDRKEFRIFINRQKNKKQRKDLGLFDLLSTSEGLDKKEILERLYPGESKKEAYHALRKRLMRHLTDFIVLKRMGHDATAASQVMGWLSLSQYLFDKTSYKLAWVYLSKAEKLAEQHEQYDLLNTIYNLQIEKAEGEFAVQLGEIIQKRNRNKRLADQDEKANIANSLIRRSLERIRLQGKVPDFEKIIDKVLKDYELTEAVVQRPRLLFNLMSISRSLVLAKKDFFSFEPFIIEQYQRLENSVGFQAQHQFYRLSLLYMIAHVLYRNKKFAESNTWLEELQKALGTPPRTYFMHFYPRNVLLRAANLSFSGQNEKAIGELENLLNTYHRRLELRDQLNARLNLSVYYFQRDDFRQANRVLLSVHHSDKFCEKKMGKEWVLRKALVELITQLELGRVDIVLNRIRSIERNFKGFLEQEGYQRAKVFLGLIRWMIDRPDDITGPEFYDLVEVSFEFIPVEQEDILAVSFYAWLKSKMLGETYYPVLIDIINRKELV